MRPDKGQGGRGSASKMVHLHSRWQEASVPHHVDSPQGCLSIFMAWELASLRASD